MKVWQFTGLLYLPSVVAGQVLSRGWDHFVFSWRAAIAFAWVFGIFLAIFIGFPLFANILARIFGSSEPLLGPIGDRIGKQPARWWHLLIWPLVILALFAFRPPWETAQGWLGLVTIATSCAAFVLLAFVFDLYVRKFVFGDRLFARAKSEAAAGELAK